MKKLTYIIWGVILLFAFVACEDKPDGYEFPVDKYIYDIPDVPVTEDYVVGVPYEIKYCDTLEKVWWNADKKIPLAYTGNPTLGEYDMRKDLEKTLKQHMDWGKEAGIDFFIFSWGGRGHNDTILMNYEKLYQAGHPQVVLRFDPGYRYGTAADSLMSTYKPEMIARYDSLKLDFDSIYHAFMVKPFAYKHKQTGNPVMVLCNFTQQGDITSAHKLTNDLRTIAGNKLWIMCEMAGNWTSPERWGYHAKNGYSGATNEGWVQPDSIKSFDAFFITDIATGNKDRYDYFYSLMDYNYNYWQKAMEPLGKEYIPMIFPSFDNLVNDPLSNTYLLPRWKDGSGAYVISGSEPEAPKYNWSNVKENPYKTLANVAKRNVGPSRMVLVYNWNNFTGGINLEPTEEFGTDYLKYTKQFFKK